MVSPPSEAWHVVTTVDAFFDSDEEDIDESARHAYGAPYLPPATPQTRCCLTFVFFSYASPGTRRFSSEHH